MEKTRLVCPKCGGAVESCPDPECIADGVVHHAGFYRRDEGHVGCDLYDIPIKDLKRITVDEVTSVVVDIVTEDDIGISVWSHRIPEDEESITNDGRIPFINIAHPGQIKGDNWPSAIQNAVSYAKTRLGDFSVKSVKAI